MGPDLVAMVDDYIESITDDREPDGFYHPSSMWGCDRKTVYEVRGEDVDSPPDKVAKRRFYVGHRLHEVVQRTLESHGDIEEFYGEGEVYVPAWKVTGHFDALIKWKGEWWLVEVKSIKRAAVKMGLPKEMHEQQAKTYWWAIKNYGFFYVELKGVEMDDEDESGQVYHPPIPKIKGVIILYLEKDDLTIHSVVMEGQWQWDSEVQDKITSLNLWTGDPDSLPPRLPRAATGRKHWLCGFCPYAKKCWNTDPAVKPSKYMSEEDF